MSSTVGPRGPAGRGIIVGDGLPPTDQVVLNSYIVGSAWFDAGSGKLYGPLVKPDPESNDLTFGDPAPVIYDFGIAGEGGIDTDAVNALIAAATVGFEARPVLSGFGRVAAIPAYDGLAWRHHNGDANEGFYLDEGYGFLVDGTFYWVSGWNSYTDDQGVTDDSFSTARKNAYNVSQHYSPYIIRIDATTNEFLDPVLIPAPAGAPVRAVPLGTPVDTSGWATDDGWDWPTITGQSFHVSWNKAWALPVLPKLSGKRSWLFAQPGSLEGPDALVFDNDYNTSLMSAVGPTDYMLLVETNDETPISWADLIRDPAMLCDTGDQDFEWYGTAATDDGSLGMAFEGGYYGLIGRRIFFGGGDGNIWDDGSGEPDPVGNLPWAGFNSDHQSSRWLMSYNVDTDEFETWATKPNGVDYSGFSVVGDDKLYVLTQEGYSPGQWFMDVFDPAIGEGGTWTSTEVTDDIVAVLLPDGSTSWISANGGSDWAPGVQIGRKLVWLSQTGLRYDLDTGVFDAKAADQANATAGDLFTDAPLAPDGTYWLLSGGQNANLVDDNGDPISIRRYDPTGQPPDGWDAVGAWLDGAISLINAGDAYYGYMAGYFPADHGLRVFGASAGVTGPISVQFDFDTALHVEPIVFADAQGTPIARLAWSTEFGGKLQIQTPENGGWTDNSQDTLMTHVEIYGLISEMISGLGGGGGGLISADTVDAGSLGGRHILNDSTLSGALNDADAELYSLSVSTNTLYNDLVALQPLLYAPPISLNSNYGPSPYNLATNVPLPEVTRPDGVVPLYVPMLNKFVAGFARFFALPNQQWMAGSIFKPGVDQEPWVLYGGIAGGYEDDGTPSRKIRSISNESGANTGTDNALPQGVADPSVVTLYRYDGDVGDHPQIFSRTYIGLGETAPGTPVASWGYVVGIGSDGTLDSPYVALADAPDARTGHGTASEVSWDANGDGYPAVSRVHIFGGIDGNGQVRPSHATYDAFTDTWDVGPDMPEDLEYCRATTIYDTNYETPTALYIHVLGIKSASPSGDPMDNRRYFVYDVQAGEWVGSGQSGRTAPSLADNTRTANDLPDIDFSLVSKNYRGPQDLDSSPRVYIFGGSLLEYDGTDTRRDQNLDNGFEVLLSNYGNGLRIVNIDDGLHWVSSSDLPNYVPAGAAVCANVYNEGIYIYGGRDGQGVTPQNIWVVRPWIRKTQIGLAELIDYDVVGQGGGWQWFSAQHYVERRHADSGDLDFAAIPMRGALAFVPTFLNMENAQVLEQTDGMNVGVAYVMAIPVSSIISNYLHLRFIVDEAVEGVVNVGLYYPYRYNPLTGADDFGEKMIKTKLSNPGAPVDVSTTGVKDIVLGNTGQFGVRSPGTLFAVMTTNANGVKMRGLAGTRQEQIHDLVRQYGWTSDARFLGFSGMIQPPPDPTEVMPDVLHWDSGGWPLGGVSFMPLLALIAGTS